MADRWRSGRNGETAKLRNLFFFAVSIFFPFPSPALRRHARCTHCLLGCLCASSGLVGLGRFCFHFSFFSFVPPSPSPHSSPSFLFGVLFLPLSLAVCWLCVFWPGCPPSAPSLWARFFSFSSVLAGLVPLPLSALCCPRQRPKGAPSRKGEERGERDENPKTARARFSGVSSLRQLAPGLFFGCLLLFWLRAAKRNKPELKWTER